MKPARDSSIVTAVALYAFAATADAQLPKKVARIRFLNVAPASSLSTHTQEFRQRGREFGYVEGENIVINSRFTKDKANRLADFADGLERLRPNIILTAGTQSEPLIEARQPKLSKSQRVSFTIKNDRNSPLHVYWESGATSRFEGVISPHDSQIYNNEARLQWLLKESDGTVLITFITPSHNALVTVSNSGVNIFYPLQPDAKTKVGSAAPRSRIESPPAKFLRPPPLRLPPEPMTPSEPEKQSVFGTNWLGKVSGGIFAFIWGCILLLLAGGTFYFWRLEAARKQREKGYIDTVERDWGSAEMLTTALRQMEHLQEQSKNWTEKQWKIYREQDMRNNHYDYDQLWEIWKRYEYRQFEPEIHALLGSTWTKDEVTKLMNFYVRETKARWQLLRDGEEAKTFPSGDKTG